MWARALAILAEDTTPKAPQGDQTVCVGVDRMAALAEGGNETKTVSYTHLRCLSLG